MKLLILGGSAFVGRAITRAALARGWQVTHFNRGVTAPEPPEGVELIRGDRHESLDALGDRHWHAVVDTSGYTPRAVAASTEALAGRVECYAFISTISVYAPGHRETYDEDAPLKTLDNPSVESVNAETYGGLKVLCEETIRERFPQNHLILRPGIIVGPYDPTGRFTYWVERLARGGPVLVPDPLDDPVQLIDAMDLANFATSLLLRRMFGIYNVCGPSLDFTFQDFLAGVGRAFTAQTEFARAPKDRLIAAGIHPFRDLPFWFHGDNAVYARVVFNRAREQGLSFHPLEETARRTREWMLQQPEPHFTGLSLKSELEWIHKLAR